MGGAAGNETKFPWVVLVEGSMHCQYCQDSAKHNAFTTGCSKFKKDALKMHTATNDHSAAVEGKFGKRYTRYMYTCTVRTVQ